MTQKKINRILIVAVGLLLFLMIFQTIQFSNYQKSFEHEARVQACLYDRRAHQNEIGQEPEQFCEDYITRWEVIERND